MGYTRTMSIDNNTKNRDTNTNMNVANGAPQELYAFPSFSSASSRSGQLYDSIEGRLMSGNVGSKSAVSLHQYQHQHQQSQPTPSRGGKVATITTTTSPAARDKERAEREREKIQRYRAGGSPRYDDQAHHSHGGKPLGSTVNSTTSSLRSDLGTDEFGVQGMNGGGKGPGTGLNSPSGSAFSTRSFGSPSLSISLSNTNTNTNINPTSTAAIRSAGDPSGDELDDYNYPASPLLSRHRTRKSVDAGTALVTESNRMRDREIEKGVRISTGGTAGGMGKKKSGGLLRGKGGGLRVEGDLRRGSEEETLEVKVVLLGSQGESCRLPLDMHLLSIHCIVKEMLIWTNTDALRLHPGVGKSTLARRYAEGTFSPQTTRPTLNGSLFTRKLNWEGGEVRLQIWDTVGEGESADVWKSGLNWWWLGADI